MWTSLRGAASEGCFDCRVFPMLPTDVAKQKARMNLINLSAADSACANYTHWYPCSQRASHRNPPETCPSGQLATPSPRCYVGKDFFHAHPEGVARRFGSSERIFSGAIRAEIFQR